MNKKAILILAVIFFLIVGTLGFLVYSRYTGENTDTNTPLAGDDLNNGNTDDLPDNSSSTDVTNLPPTDNFFKLTTTEQVVSPILFYNGNGITYLTSQGQLYKSDFDVDTNGQISLTRSRSLDIEAKSGIGRILWPKNGDDFIAEMKGEGGTNLYTYFNFSTGAYVDLASQVTSLQWLPSGDKVVFLWTDKNAEGVLKSTLNIANPDTTGYQTIAEMYETDDVIYVSPDGLNLIYHRTQNEDSTNKLTLTTPDGKIWRDLVSEGYNYGVLWSPDSQKFLFGKREKSGKNYQLWVFDLYSGEIKNLGVYSTPSKAVWSSDSRIIYTAAPKDGQTVSDSDGLNSSFSTDTFYKLDISTLEKVEFTPENLSIDGRELFLDPSEDKLFFKNAQDGGLYYVDLRQQN